MNVRQINRFYALLAGLAVLAALIWLRDLAWLNALDDALPALLAMPLFWHLGRPWTLRQQPLPLPHAGTAAAALLLAAGTAADWTLLLAAGWTGLLAVLLHCHVSTSVERRWQRLLGLALLAFPWLVFEAQPLGWWFRWTGAAAADFALTALQLDVTRHGTQLVLSSAAITVGESCSGLKGLQSMMIGGVVMTWLLLGSRCRPRVYWCHVPILFCGAWLANTLRIVVTALGAQWLSVEFVEGQLHFWQGWLLLCLMFAACGGALWMMRPRETATC